MQREDATIHSLDAHSYPVYACFFALIACTGVVWMNICLSKNFSTSSMRLGRGRGMLVDVVCCVAFS